MDSSAIIKVEEDSKLRCQSVNAYGQCMNQVIEGQSWCPIHISSHQKDLAKREVRIYNLTNYRAEVQRFAEQTGLTNLREEVGMLRTLLQTIWNKCNSEVEFVLHSNVLSELIVKIQKIVKDCHSLEKSSGELLSKTATLKIAGDIIDIINTHVTDPTILERISKDIIEKVLNALPSETDD